LTCGWSEDGLQTFNQLAKEVSINRKERGEEFDNACKTRITEKRDSFEVHPENVLLFLTMAQSYYDDRTTSGSRGLPGDNDW
jgi:hypothetical protein